MSCAKGASGLLVLLVSAGAASAQPKPPPGMPRPELPPLSVPQIDKKELVKVQDVLARYARLRGNPGNERAELVRPLREMAEDAAPLLQAVLADKDSPIAAVFGALDFLQHAYKGDRKPFIEVVIGRCSDENHRARAAAVELLGVIGSERDTGPVLALLSDKTSARYEAVRTIVKIGGRRDVTALDAWVKYGSATFPDDEDFFKHVRQHRDDLVRRLLAEANLKNAKN